MLAIRRASGVRDDLKSGVVTLPRRECCDKKKIKFKNLFFLFNEINLKSFSLLVFFFLDYYITSIPSV